MQKNKKVFCKQLIVFEGFRPNGYQILNQRAILHRAACLKIDFRFFRKTAKILHILCFPIENLPWSLVCIYCFRQGVELYSGIRLIFNFVQLQLVIPTAGGGWGLRFVYQRENSSATNLYEPFVAIAIFVRNDVMCIRPRAKLQLKLRVGGMSQISNRSVSSPPLRFESPVFRIGLFQLE